ncbi:pseudopodium-enriched atypical kinase 1-like [Sinocyclocheilus anshuiensis]|uniref:pseudopodium-enriched atypical kinase 1-like n=1 Tax=Sinocyclocheilus anshuiensis TaxID=1608454 RepID=UPI0007B9B46F|nr:PREDICTED: pseudopodium-enriched atypical kinase 1-like [Sinocyclocheilus anshuiensis]
MLQHCPAVMSACNTFTEHVWKPGECKNCFKPKSLHRPPEQANAASESKTNISAKLTNSQRSISSSRAGQVRPPVAKKPTIAVKPTMMLPCSPAGLDSEGNVPRLTEGAQVTKSSPFTVWNHNSRNSSRPTGTNNNQGEDLVRQTEAYGAISLQPTSSNNNGLTDVLKEIAGLGPSPSSSRDDFFGRICSSYQRSLERGLPASSCLHAGSSGRGAMKRVSLSDSAEVISSEGGRFCYPEFSSDGDDEEDESGDEDDDDGEHDSWDESDEELLAMGIRMRGQPRFANFRAATLSPVPFAVGKKWNTVPLRNRSLQRFCAVDYDDSYDEILNGYPSVDSNGAPALLSYTSDHQGSGSLSTSESTTSPESLISLPEESCAGSSRGTGDQRNSLPFPPSKEPSAKGLSSPKPNEMHKAVLAIRLEEQDDSKREGGALPQAFPGQPITISFSPTEEQAKPYRVVNLEKTPICKPYTVVDVSASMATKNEHTHSSESTPKSSGPNVVLCPSADPCPVSPTSPQSPRSPVSLVASPSVSLSPLMPQSPTSSASGGPSGFRTKPGSIRYQEVWTSCTSPRQKIPKVDLTSGCAAPRLINHKSAPTSPTAGFGSARTVPTKSPNLSEIKFNSYNNAGMPPFPIIIRDEPAYARSSKKAVKVPIVINPCAYDNLAVYKSFLGLNGEVPHSKPGARERVASHTYEEIGSSESSQPSPSEQTPSQMKHTTDVTAPGDLRTTKVSAQTINDGKSRTTTVVSVLPAGSMSPGPAVLAHSSLDRIRNPSSEQPAEGSKDCQVTSNGSSGQREKASAVLYGLSQLPVQGTEISSATSLPAKLELSPLRELTASCPPPASPTSNSSRQAEREEEGITYTISHSPTSSSCRATYTNLGRSRANMIPVKHPRHPKASDDTLTSDPEVIESTTKSTPPPLPKKSVPRAQTEPSALGRELSAPRPKGEARPGGTSLSVANPLYDLESTWDTTSQSSSLSSEARHPDESGDSLERPVGGQSLSCLTNSSSMQACDLRGFRSTESLTARTRGVGRPAKAQKQVPYRGMESWEEVVGRIRGLHTDTLRKLAARCEDRFMAGQKDHLRFGTDSWSHFRLTAGKPCCEAGDAVYYTASFAKEPLTNYAVKICRGVVKETQQQFFHSLAVRQSIAVHFNIQQDCGHFLADVPARLLPWEREKDGEDKQGGTEGGEEGKGKEGERDAAGPGGKLCSRVVVITREVPFQTVADFVREGVERHARNPELYERQVCLLLLQLCVGLEHMKPYHVTHCDLRLENLLLVHCQPGNPWNLELLEPNNNTASGPSSTAASACPARLIISNFSQAKLKSVVLEPASLRDQSRLAPELLTATQYRKCDEFQTGILIYEMLHRPNPFEESPELKEREYCSSDLPQLPLRSLYSNGLQQLATLLLNPNPTERIQMADARACLQCLLWGPREDLFNLLNPSSGTVQRHTVLQNWLDLKRTLMMIKFAERSLDTGCGVSLEDWLCCQYLAFATTESLSRVIKILQQPQGVLI